MTRNNKAGLAGYFPASLRAMAGELRRMLRDADRDDDIVSVTVLSTGPRGDHLRADGAVVVIKGGNYVELFSQWAERNKLLARGKSIVGPEGVRSTLLDSSVVLRERETAVSA